MKEDTVQCLDGALAVPNPPRVPPTHYSEGRDRDAEEITRCYSYRCWQGSCSATASSHFTVFDRGVAHFVPSPWEKLKAEWNVWNISSSCSTLYSG